jgi:hypothetical protein
MIKENQVKIRVQRCWGYFRLINPEGQRECITGEEWTRELAKRALDIYENCYHYSRRNIRFDHE